MSGPGDDSRRCRAEIDLGALRQNASVAAELAGSGSELMAVVKADGYGHGIREVAGALAEQCRFLGVANLEEARAIRPLVDDPSRVFLLGPALPEERRAIVEEGFTISVSSIEEAESFQAAGNGNGKKVPFHLAVDTGMGRIGFSEDEATVFAESLAKFGMLECTGLYSHLPSADEDDAFTTGQIDAFAKLAQELAGTVRSFQWRHLGNSAGLIGFETLKACTNLVRPGLMLYGVSPRPEFAEKLKPVLTWKTRVTLLRDLPPGRGISYGRTFFTSREPTTRVATLAVGYGDGYPRHLSGQGAEVLVGGSRCPVLGRVTMDQIMVDVSDVDGVSIGDDVVLLGCQQNESISASEIASRAGTIPWEVFTGITRRVARVYR